MKFLEKVSNNMAKFKFEIKKHSPEILIGAGVVGVIGSCVLACIATTKVEKILETLLKKHQIVLIDTDFSTDFDYFSYSQQVYLIQTMNVLTIQQLTEFLSKLKSQNVIDDDKIRIILNKYMEIDGITIKQLIGGLAFYNDPSMSYMQQIFEKNGARYTTLSYNQHAYERYLQDIAK